MSLCAYIVIPIYNVEKYLQACIESVLAQTYWHIKIILIDDGSTDQSGMIAQRYTKDPRVLLVTQENKGLSCARNVGIEIAMRDSINQEDILVFLDSDDVMHKSYIQTMQKAFKRDPSVKIAIGGVQVIDEEGGLLIEREEKDEALKLSGMEYLKTIKGNYFAFAWGGGI